jgi:cobalt-zinc-cadmium efflux system protein
LSHDHDHDHGHDRDHRGHDDRDPARAAERSPDVQLGPAADRCEVISDRRATPAADGAHDAGGAGHCHHGHGRERDSRRLAISLGITGAILVAEVVGGVISGSLALLSDAGHMLTDLSAQLLSLLALLFAARPATPKRTFGYHRLEILAALLNGIVLVLLAGYIIWQAWLRIGSPPAIRTEIMMIVAGIGLAANVVSARLLSRSRSLNVRAAYTHIVSDALASVAVLLGGAVMYWFDGPYVLDPILGFAIGLFVVISAWRLIRESTDVLLEAVPADIDVEQVREDMRRLDGIEDVHDLHIWTITSGLYALSAHIVVAKDGALAKNDELLVRTKQLLLRNHRIAHSTLQIETTEYEHVSHVT